MSENTKDVCRIHGKGHIATNRMLIIMTLLSLAFICWHVWEFGVSSKIPVSELAELTYPQKLYQEFSQLFFSRKGVLAELVELIPYLVAGVLIAGYIRTARLALKLQASIRKYGNWSVVVATFAGLISPLCACGTVTTAVGLLFAGVPLAPVMALMVTSPLMSPSTYLLTLNDLGAEWTVIRTLAAFFMGISTGYLTHYLAGKGFFKGGVFIDGTVVKGDLHDEDYPDERLKCSCRESFGNRVAHRTDSFFLVFLAKSAEMLVTVGKYVVIGVFIGSVAERYIPYSWIYRFFGSSNPLNVLWITFSSVPVFLHQISVSSIVAHIRDSLPLTIDGSAALAFMIGGPVSAIPTMVIFWTLLKRRIFFLYLFICIFGTSAIAYTAGALIFVSGVDYGNPLIKGVSILRAGDSAIFTKKSPDIRGVISFEGSLVSAMITDPLASSGGVLFDGSPARILSTASDDNRYKVNAARWLADQTASSKARSVLVLAEKELENDISSAVKPVLNENGFIADIKLFEVNNNDYISDDYGQLWVFAGGEAQGAKYSEVSRKFAENGGSVFIILNPVDKASSSLYLEKFNLGNFKKVRLPDQIQVAKGGDFMNYLSKIVAKLMKMTGKG